MVLPKRIRSIKRFGARYGSRVKQRLGMIEHLQKKKYKCPYCNAVKVRRKSAGIWKCHKCHKVFTGKAYTLK